ncbi:hypothetical protein K458DRAFT_487654 [Lentithecium fluviatile CBS 122367]|uniref:Uncharacterized protein n=1 Tax=Lentithecium fluviatile CBS 122367 TaxID=1168545 RepID=A0A6G1J1Z9_9PLEO|nr:hypothetical protein K458DRAFT_487654 [Lentithecium fluviatile CBS 122367]
MNKNKSATEFGNKFWVCPGCNVQQADLARLLAQKPPPQAATRLDNYIHHPRGGWIMSNEWEILLPADIRPPTAPYYGSYVWVNANSYGNTCTNQRFGMGINYEDSLCGLVRGQAFEFKKDGEQIDFLRAVPILLPSAPEVPPTPVYMPSAERTPDQLEDDIFGNEGDDNPEPEEIKDINDVIQRGVEDFNNGYFFQLHSILFNPVPLGHCLREHYTTHLSNHFLRFVSGHISSQTCPSVLKFLKLRLEYVGADPYYINLSSTRMNSKKWLVIVATVAIRDDGEPGEEKVNKF